MCNVLPWSKFDQASILMIDAKLTHMCEHPKIRITIEQKTETKNYLRKL